MGNDEVVRYGVIGCGGITNFLKVSAFHTKNIKIAAAMDINVKNANKIGGKKHAYTDLQKMYDNEDFDAVYIATPHFLHKPMIKQAFKEGKHVLCEKPVTITVEDARDLNQFDKQYKSLKLGFNYNYRYDHKCYRLASGIQNKHIGRVYYANCSVFFSRDATYFEKGTWRTKRETAGGGTLLIHGSHLIDVMMWAIGEPISVIGKIDTLKFRDIEVEDIGFGIVEFENGAYAQINNSQLVTPPVPKRGKDKVELQIFGEKGHCFYEGPWPRSSLKWKGVKKLKVEKNTKGLTHFGRSIKAFGNWVKNDKPYFNTLEESTRVLRLIIALYKSSETCKKELIEKL